MRDVFGRGIGIRHLGAILGLLAVAAPSAAMAPALIAAPMVHVAVVASGAASHSAVEAKDAGGAAAHNAQSHIDTALAARLDELSSKTGAWQWTDLIERGRIAIGQGDFGGAAIAFEAATQCAPDDAARVMTQYCLATCLIAKAQALPRIKSQKAGIIAAGQAIVSDASQPHPMRDRLLRQAGEILNATQCRVPQSMEIAALRVTAWSLLNDNVERMAAEHHARFLDPSKEGTPRCDLVTIGVIALVVFVSGKFALETFTFDGYLEPEQRMAILKVCDSGARVTGGLLAGGGLVEVFMTELVK